MNFEEIKQDKARFLNEYDIATEFELSGYDWDELIAIAEDFHIRRSEYEIVAQKYLTEISQLKYIHSYRHRVKAVDSFIKKIITRASSKHERISIDNYRIEITDLIGIRVLYVFKSDYFRVHEQIYQRYKQQMTQNIHVKLRVGDDPSIYDEIKSYDPIFEPNSDYRSIHYTINSNETDMRDARLEIQTRSVFEEGWSEINHKLVYKNKQNASYFALVQASRILSVMVGNCDTLGELMKNVQNEYRERMKGSSDAQDVINEDAIMDDVLMRFLNND